jgi:hypothetical protein
VIGLAIALTLAGTAADSPASGATLERCFVMIEDRGKITLSRFTQLDLIHGDAAAALPDLPVAHVVAIDCGRDSVVPSPGDYRVLRDYGIPLDITCGDRLVALEEVKGHVQIRFAEGKMTNREAQVIQRRLDTFQLELRPAK